VLAAAALLSTAVSAQPASGWRLTVQLTSGSHFCTDGARAAARLTGRDLSVYYQGESFPRWTVLLAADGSADALVATLTDSMRNDTVQVKVPAGTGPREISGVTQRDACRLRYIPD
jgi:hypothetical protein